MIPTINPNMIHPITLMIHSSYFLPEKLFIGANEMRTWKITHLRACGQALGNLHLLYFLPAWQTKQQ